MIDKKKIGKKIGSGAQYKVFEYGEDKVIKIPLTFEEIFKQQKKWNEENNGSNFNNATRKKLERFSLENILDRKKSINFIKKTKINFLFLGNPLFEKESITQDRVITIREYISSNKSGFSDIIDNYVKLILETWKYGFSEKVFNFTINNGVDKNNNVILIDFGELHFKKKDIESAIKQKIWEKKYSYNKGLNKKQQEVFSEKMNEKITLENLEKYWCKRC